MHSEGLLHWDDIAGQFHAKQLVQEMVVWPMMNPHIFKGARAPPKGLLLFGPPGTGKTLIGKAIASNINATFFNISASSLTSKWIGQGEKMVRTLFAVATCLQPAVIFIDEIDSLLSARKTEGEHESSRRLKTEMLVQMEGCDPSSNIRRVLLVGATNRPEELDEAARRRLPKQLYIPLPCSEARQQMILRVLGPEGSVTSNLSESDLSKIVEKTAGYSGSDMRNLIQEACQGPVRDALCSGVDRLSHLSESDLRPVNLGDFAVAARAQRRTVNDEEVKRYENYNAVYGAKHVSHNESQEDIMLEDNW
uniref:Fidgetin-like protein 1-like n=2 Tax=Tetraselmis sp. GSL018 TaxID=582737 RepID=A0A061QLS8_9CHLO